ncbi:inner membrane CreD family protein, partial [bacterium]|nr:inner membrane CreD family protein [bacterium]
MGKRIAAIVVIYLFACVAWFFLGGTVATRTSNFNARLLGEVEALWGTAQAQPSPELVFERKVKRIDKEWVSVPGTKKQKLVEKERWEWVTQPVILDKSHLDVNFDLEHRNKGLFWYSTYVVDFDGRYSYQHVSEYDGFLSITYRFPTQRASYENFRFAVNDQVDPQITPEARNGEKVVVQRVPVKKGDVVPFELAYRSRGMDWWRYNFGSDVNRIKNFELVMSTNFESIDFPAGTISPTSKVATDDGWELKWEFDNLISGFEVGMQMPEKMNPGPLAAQISFFAPVSLGFFFLWMFVITLLRRIELHPINYLFLAAAFFAFHLLFAYTVDHLPVLTAFGICSAVSVFLVVSYLRLVVGLRFAALEAGGSQLLYLVFFSYAH